MRQGPDRAADLQQNAVRVEILRQRRRAPRGQIGLASGIQIQRLEAPRGLQQQWRRIAPVTVGEGDAGAQKVHLGTLELVDRPGFRRRSQLERRVERTGLQTRLGCGESAIRPPRRVIVSATARLKNAAAAASPPRAWARPAERSSSMATCSFGPAVAAARCQARRSGSIS